MNVFFFFNFSKKKMTWYKNYKCLQYTDDKKTRIIYRKTYDPVLDATVRVFHRYWRIWRRTLLSVYKKSKAVGLLWKSIHFSGDETF